MASVPTSARVVVIGAGIVGNSLVYHLARLGWRDIVQIDKGPLPNPGGSTGHASNFIFPVDHSRELADLRLAGLEAVRVDGLTRTLDMWFDNIFTDLAVRDRIRDAHGRVGHALRAVETTLNDLTGRGHAITAELEELSRQRERTLLG